MLKVAGLELILVVDHHHGTLIVVIRLEARHADHSLSVSSILPKLSRQRFFSTGSTPHITGSKMQSDEGAALFVVLVNVIVMCLPSIIPQKHFSWQHKLTLRTQCYLQYAVQYSTKTIAMTSVFQYRPIRYQSLYRGTF